MDIGGLLLVAKRLTALLQVMILFEERKAEGLAFQKDKVMDV